MTTVAGIDVGNATTEVVVARVTDGRVEVVAADRAPTRRTKGSPESLAGVVALVRRLERRHGVRVERAVAAPLRPVLTEGASLPEERPADRPAAGSGDGSSRTAGGGGFGAGRPVPFGAALGPEPVVVVVPSGLRYDDVARALSGPVASGLVAAVLLEDDEAVLVANRLPAGVPVVDEVAPDAVLAAERVAVEVPLDGRPLQVLTDPLKLATALGLLATEVADAATLAGQLFDVPNAVVALDSSARPTTSSPSGWIEVAGTRLPFLAGQEQVRSGRVGDAGGYAVPPGLEPREVDDLWAVDLGAVASSVLARRSAARSRPVALAAMHTTAGWSDPAAAAGRAPRRTRDHRALRGRRRAGRRAHHARRAGKRRRGRPRRRHDRRGRPGGSGRRGRCR